MTNRVRAAWARIDRVLEREVPDVFDGLGFPASEAELRDLAKAIGRPLPQDLVDSLRVHDGHDGSDGGCVFDGEWLLPVEDILKVWTMNNEVMEGHLEDGIEGWWDPRFIPFARQDSDSYCIDSGAPGGPVVKHDHAMGIDWSPESASLAEFLEDLAARFEAGRYIKDHGSLWPNHPDLGRAYTIEPASLTLSALASRLQGGAWQLAVTEDQLRMRSGLLRVQIYPQPAGLELYVSGFGDLDEAASCVLAIARAADINVRLKPPRQY